MRWCRLVTPFTALSIAANISCPEQASSSGTGTAVVDNSDLAPAASALQFSEVEVLFAEIHGTSGNAEPSSLTELSEDFAPVNTLAVVDNLETPRTLANDENLSVQITESGVCLCNHHSRLDLGHAQLRVVQWIIVALGLLMSIVLCSAGRSTWDQPANDGEPESNRPVAALRAVNRPARALSVASSRASLQLPPYDYPPPAYGSTAVESVTRAPASPDLQTPHIATMSGHVPAFPDGHYAIHEFDSRLFNVPTGISSASQAIDEESADPSNSGPFR